MYPYRARHAYCSLEGIALQRGQLWVIIVIRQEGEYLEYLVLCQTEEPSNKLVCSAKEVRQRSCSRLEQYRLLNVRTAHVPRSVPEFDDTSVI